MYTLVGWCKDYKHGYIYKCVILCNISRIINNMNVSLRLYAEISGGLSLSDEFDWSATCTVIVLVTQWEQQEPKAHLHQDKIMII